MNPSAKNLRKLEELLIDLGEMGAYASGRVTPSEAEDIYLKVTPLIKKLGARKYELAGSYRRGKSDLGDLDIIVTDIDLGQVRDELPKYVDLIRIARAGGVITTVVINYKDKEVQVEFVKVESESFGAALLHSTGSQMFNVGLRTVAKNKGFMLNQYGLYKMPDKTYVAGATEDQVFNALNMDSVPPGNRSVEHMNHWWNIYRKYRRSKD